MKTFLQRHKKFVCLFISLCFFVFSILFYRCNINLFVDVVSFRFGLCVGCLLGFAECYFVDFIDLLLDSKRNSPPSGEDK